MMNKEINKELVLTEKQKSILRLEMKLFILRERVFFEGPKKKYTELIDDMIKELESIK
jgi:hypothetical protein